MPKNTVKRKDISPSAVKRNKGPKRVIFLGSVYVFNGYGWTEENKCSEGDLKKYPQLIADD